MTLPINPSISSASVGKDFLLHVNTGTVETPTWSLVGGQRSASLSRSADEIDVSCKTNDGWKATKAGLRTWSIDLDGLVLLADTGLAALELAFMTGVEIHIKLLYPDGSYQTGWGSLTDFSLETPHDGEATIKGTISGNGAIGSRVPNIYPLTATVSKASAVDKVFSIVPTTTTVSAVKDGGTALEVTTDYTYSAGTLTIKAAYFTAADVGTHVFAATTGDAEATLAFTVVESA